MPDTDYATQAQEFLSTFDLVLFIDFMGPECPTWDEGDQHIHGDRWNIGIKRIEKGPYSDRWGDILEFPFWNSHHDANGWRKLPWSDNVTEESEHLGHKRHIDNWKMAHPPTPYEILACIGSDVQGYTDPDDVYQEFGEMKPSQAKAIANHTVKLRLFFTTPEQEALAEIQ